MDDNFPVSEKLEVIKGINVYKTDSWWSAVILLDSFGRKQVATYLWQNVDGSWKRRQKFVISSNEDWKKYKSIIEELLVDLEKL